MKYLLLALMFPAAAFAAPSSASNFNCWDAEPANVLVAAFQQPNGTFFIQVQHRGTQMQVFNGAVQNPAGVFKGQGFKFDTNVGKFNNQTNNLNVPICFDPPPAQDQIF
jgi:hypothetical protein